MEIRKETRDVYLVNGKEFFSLEEAKMYEKKLNDFLKYTYYFVSHNPDLTEGRGYYKKTIVGVSKYSPSNVLLQYLVKSFGEPIARVMGVAPMNNWVIGEPLVFDSYAELVKVLGKEYEVGIGDYRKWERLTIYLLNDFGDVALEVKGIAHEDRGVTQ